MITAYFFEPPCIKYIRLTRASDPSGGLVKSCSCEGQFSESLERGRPTGVVVAGRTGVNGGVQVIGSPRWCCWRLSGVITLGGVINDAEISSRRDGSGCCRVGVAAAVTDWPVWERLRGVYGGVTNGAASTLLATGNGLEDGVSRCRAERDGVEDVDEDSASRATDPKIDGRLTGGALISSSLSAWLSLMVTGLVKVRWWPWWSDGCFAVSSLTLWTSGWLFSLWLST